MSPHSSPQCHHNNALCAQTRSRHQCCRTAPCLIITCHPSVAVLLWSWSGPAICVVISIGITHIVHYCHPPIIVLQLTICQPLVIIPSIMVLAITCNLIFVPDGSSSLNILMIIIQIHPPLVSNTLKPSWLVSDSYMVPLSRKTGQVKMFSPIQNAPTLYR